MQKSSSPITRYLFWLIAAAWVYTLTFVFNNYWSKYASYESVTKSVQVLVQERGEAFNTWAADTLKLQSIISGEQVEEEIAALRDKPYHFYIYKKDKSSSSLVFWSTNEVAPDSKDVESLPSGVLVSYGSGEYEFLRKPVTIRGELYEVIGLVLLHKGFFIENLRFQRGYPGLPGLEGKMRIVETRTQYPVYGASDEPLFYFSPMVPEPIYVFNLLSFITACLATLLLFVYIYKVASGFMIIRKPLIGIAFLFGALWLLLMGMRYGIPIDFSDLPYLWDARGKELLQNRQWLIDLAVDSVLACLVVLFFSHHIPTIFAEWNQLSARQKRFIFVPAVFLLVHLQFLVVGKVQQLFLNDAVSFDLTNYQSLNQSTLLAFFILFVLSYTHFLVLGQFTTLVKTFGASSIYLILLGILAAGLLLLTFSLHQGPGYVLLFSLFWLIVMVWIFVQEGAESITSTLGTNVVWMFLYALSLGVLLSTFTNGKIRKQAGELAQGLLLQNDLTSDYEMRIATTRMRRVNWQETLRTCEDYNRCHQIKQEIIGNFFSGYLDRFSTELYFFDAKNKTLGSVGQVSYEQLNTLFSEQAEEVGMPFLAKFDEAFDKFGYIIKLPVGHDSTENFAGSVFAITRPTLQRNQALSPELFKSLKNFATDLPRGVSYAWYRNGTISEQYRNYSFPSKVEAGKLGRQSQHIIENGNAIEVWLATDNKTVLAVAIQYKPYISFITLVSYLFCGFVIFYFILSLIVVGVQPYYWQSGKWLLNGLSLKASIRLIIVGILVLSFLIIAVITISFYTNQYRDSNEERLAKAAQHIAAELLRSGLTGWDSLLSKTGERGLLLEALENASVGLNLDANLFDTSGQLIAATQNMLYEKKVMSRLVEPMAWWQMTHGGVNRIMANEQVGNLKYTSVYQQLKNTNQQTVAYLQIPWFASQNDLNQEISNFVVILINLIAFVFLISGAFAIWMSGTITRSFNIIRSKMDSIQLAGANEKIEWHRKDEIGMLINQYNKMIDQLEDSARKLAKSEREMAWREMARQVAHEIKNPLTPMKLSLQYLQKAIEEDRPDVMQVAGRVANSLVEQINHLSLIAGEFSQFANLQQNRPELFDLRDEIEQAIHLYQIQDKVIIRWFKPDESIMLWVDKTQLNRLLTNLLKNAVEASEEQAPIILHFQSYVEDNQVIMAISDNGKGIPDELATDIFTPNFTTKSGGTGLGLAMCKAIVEKAGGKIWFETLVDRGTTFFVQLPLHRSALVEAGLE